MKACRGRHLLVACVAVALSGCANYNPKYNGYYSFAQTRKIVDSKTYPVFKMVFAPLIFIPETVASPVTAYMDSAQHPPESDDGHVYLSYVGFRTMRNAQETSAAHGTLFVAQSLVTIVDTLWFPVAGVMDTAYIMTLDNPEQNLNREEREAQEDPPPQTRRQSIPFDEMRLDAPVRAR